jgi:aquaporin Z
MSIGKRAAAEFFGTFWLVFGGCGASVLAAAFPRLGIGFVGVALAFGLTVLTMAYAIGHISGCHLNPAISVGLLVGKRFSAADLVPYIFAQVAGGICGAGVLYVIASGKEGFSVAGGFASNGYGPTPPAATPWRLALSRRWFSLYFSCSSSWDQRISEPRRASRLLRSGWA